MDIYAQEFDLEFIKSKSNKSLVFVELLCDFLYNEMENMEKDSLPDESLFLMSTL